LTIVGSLPTQDMNKVRYPDVVANLRVDQAWGSAQIMGALHDVDAGYFGATVGSGTCSAGVAGVSGNTCSGNPNDKMGFAVGAAIKVNFPMIGPGDYFQGQVNYTQGAVRYAALTPSSGGGQGIFGNGTGQGTNFGLGWFTDGIYCGQSSTGAATAACPFSGGSSIQLTTTWSVQAAYEHFWTPALRTSLVGGYTDVRYNDVASNMMCGNVSGAAGTISGLTNCGPGSWNFQYYSISSRTQWNITKDFYVGLEGFYGHLNTMSNGQTALYTAAAAGAQPTGTRTLTGEDVWVYRMRVHRDLVP